MSRRRIALAFAFALTYLWVEMIHLGALVFETFVIYPNIFHDVPHSLETSTTFMSARGPADFFRPVGFLALLVGAGSVILSWPVKSARYWLVASVVLIVLGELVLSAVFFWPRNEIMFVEGLEGHSGAFLRQTAWEFQTAHWLRFASSVGVAALAFVGVLKLYRHRITLEFARRKT